MPGAFDTALKRTILTGMTRSGWWSRWAQALALASALAYGCGGQSDVKPLQDGDGGEPGGGGSGDAGGGGSGGASSTGATSGAAGVGGTGVNGGAGAGGVTGGEGGLAGAAGEAGAGGTGGIEPHCDPTHVYDGSVLATTDEELEALRYYDVIDGDLVIEGQVTSLGALHCLARLQGLSIRRTDIINLAGLERLELVSGELLISGNPDLDDLGAVESLTTVGAALRLGGYCDDQFGLCEDDVYTDVGGFRNLTSVGALHLTTTFVHDLVGFAALESIAGDLEIGDNGNLTNLEGLQKLREIPGDLSILGNRRLASLAGLENVARVGGNLTIDAYDGLVDMPSPRNSVLTNLDGLAGLTNVSGDLVVTSNPALVSLRGLAELAGVRRLEVTYNTDLPSCEADWLLESIGSENVESYRFFSNTGSGTCPSGI